MFNPIRHYTVLFLMFCCGMSLHAQQKPQEKFKLLLSFEKAYLVTDREVYVQGENIWLKAYLVNAENNRPARSSATLHLELVSAADSLILNETLLLSDGSAKGDIRLPANLSPGNYRLRAYTSWMNNFGDNFIYEKKISILSSTAETAGARGKTGNKQIQGVAASKNKTMAGNAEVCLRFFPEGGSMVQNLTSIVAVKAEAGTSGRGLEIDGAIVCQQTGDTVTHFKCDTLGMGLFVLLPLKGNSYVAHYRYAGKSSQASLPSALAEGPVLRVSQTDSAFVFSAMLSAKVTPAWSSLSLMIRHAGKLFFDNPATVDSLHPLTLRLAKKLLPAGVSCVTLVDAQKRPLCERLIYNEGPEIRIGLSYQNDTKKPATISLTDAGGKPLQAELSIAITDAQALLPGADHIVSYLLLESEVSGPIERPDLYFDRSNANRLKEMDRLLLTQGWRDYIWRRLLDSNLRISYAPEQGLVVKGRVKDRDTDKPMIGSYVSLNAGSSEGEHVFMEKTDEEGRFYFGKLIQYGQAPVMLKAMDIKGNFIGKVVIDSLSRPSKSAGPSMALPLPDDPSGTLSVLAQNARGINRPQLLKEVKIKGRNDMVQLRDMVATSFGYKDEVLTIGPAAQPGQDLRNYILNKSKQAKIENAAEMNIGDPGGGVKFGSDTRLNRLVFYADGETFDPRLIVNGYEVPLETGDEASKNDQYNRYLDQPVSRFEKVVIKHMLTPPRLVKSEDLKHGFVNLGGPVIGANVLAPSKSIFIIYLTSKTGALDLEPTTTFTINGLYRARDFYTTELKDIPADKNNTANTLLWEPTLKTDATGQASVTIPQQNQRKKMIITVQGLTADGAPVFFRKGY